MANDGHLSHGGIKSQPGGNRAMLTGVILNWDIERGFGFIGRDDGEDDLFVHVRGLVDARDDHLPVGLRVCFEIGTDRSGRQHARNVRSLAEYKSLQES